MNSSESKSLFRTAMLAGLGMAMAMGQTQDNSGNGLLKGNYQFRNIAVQDVDGSANPIQVTATYGLIVFDGNGNYTVTGTQVDNTVSSGAPQPFSTTGSYAIGSNGAGYIASPLYPSDADDYEYGAVSQGVFAGSATEAEAEGYVLNDIFVAIPVGTAPTNASFTASYQTGLLDFQGGNSKSIMNALFALSPDGKGNFGAITLNGQASNQTASATLTQAISGATYNFATNGTATLTIPLPTGVSSTNALITGSKTMFQSADGNFILGWTANGYDIIFGVKALASPATNSITQGLYFTASLEDSPTISGTDSYYGGDSMSGNAAGDTVVHARLNFPNFLSYDYGTDDQIVLNSSGATTDARLQRIQLLVRRRWTGVCRHRDGGKLFASGGLACGGVFRKRCFPESGPDLQCRELPAGYRQYCSGRADCAGRHGPVFGIHD